MMDIALASYLVLLDTTTNYNNNKQTNNNYKKNYNTNSSTPQGMHHYRPSKELARRKRKSNGRGCGSRDIIFMARGNFIMMECLSGILIGIRMIGWILRIM